MITHGRTEVSGVDYAYLEAGRGPLVLFGHGTFGSKELFRPQLEALSDRWRCVAIDWPGHGQSGYDPAGWDAESLVASVSGLMDGLGAQTAVLAGLSQGGAIFTRFALRCPRRVRGLIAMSAGPAAPSSEALNALRELADALGEPDESVRRARARTLVLALFHGPGFGDTHPEAIDAEIDVMLSHPRQALSLLPGVPASYESISDQLPQLSVPTLVIWGTDDARPRLGAEIAALIPHARLAEIERAGHHVNVDAPGATTLAIREFLERLEEAR